MSSSRICMFIDRCASKDSVEGRLIAQDESCIEWVIRVIHEWLI
jgi:hypothetical protein